MKRSLVGLVLSVATLGGIAMHVVDDHWLRAAPPMVVTKRNAAWAGLSQTEIDRLTGILTNLPARPVAIFCAHLCDELALDFDNAFESAHWESGIERPLVDTNVGINVGCAFQEGECPLEDPSRSLAEAIGTATAGRLAPGLIDAKLLGGRLALVISRKK